MSRVSERSDRTIIYFNGLDHEALEENARAPSYWRSTRCGLSFFSFRLAKGLVTCLMCLSNPELAIEP